MKLIEIAVTKIRANAQNPRSFTRDQDLDDLQKSIEVHGIIEPLIVRAIADDNGRCYEVIAGHRRLMAADGLLEVVPCVVRSMQPDDDGTVLALVENTQRVDLTPYEQAKAIAAALSKGMKQKALASAIGRSQTHVSKFVKIMKAAKMLANRGDSADYFDDYTSYDELYEHAREVLGEKKPEAAAEAGGEQGDIEEEAGAGEVTEGSEDALKSLILGHAELTKVKFSQDMTVDSLGGSTMVAVHFKTMKDAEKFFRAYSVSTSK